MIANGYEHISMQFRACVGEPRNATDLEKQNMKIRMAGKAKENDKLGRSRSRRTRNETTDKEDRLPDRQTGGSTLYKGRQQFSC